MLRPTAAHNRDYLKQVKSNFGGLFLSNTARNKKDDDKSEKRAFDFSQVNKAINSKSLKEFMDQDASPLILICVVLCFIAVLYLIIASFAMSFGTSSPTVDASGHTQYPRELMIEIEEVLTKLMDLKKVGNMKDYEAFLEPTMQKYCLDNLGRGFMDRKSLESFHMNLAQTISFVAAGNALTQHKYLMVTRYGGIIDPENSKEPRSVINSAKSCPLLNALYELGASKKSDKGKNGGIAANNDAESNSDSDEKFDQQYSWQNMEEFMDLIYKSMTSTGQCLRIIKELKKDNIKAFILNFYEMADIIGRATEKEVEAGADLEDYVVDEKDVKKYVIGKDGGVYHTEQYDDESDEYFRCGAIERILNDKFVLDENLSYTNVKIAVGEKFDGWYNKKILPMIN